MPISCCISTYKSTRNKNSDIKFYRFPFKNKISMKYWIATTGRNNWFPYSGVRICSMHFTAKDYYNTVGNINRRHLKLDVIPSRNVHPNILQVFQQDTHEINKCNRYVIENEEELNDGIPPMIPECDIDVVENEKEPNDGTPPTIPECDIDVVENEEEPNDETPSMIPECSKYDLLNENKELKKKIDEMKKFTEERLNQQAIMFRELMRKKEIVLKEKLEIMKKKNKTLNNSVQIKFSPESLCLLQDLKYTNTNLLQSHYHITSH